MLNLQLPFGVLDKIRTPAFPSQGDTGLFVHGQNSTEPLVYPIVLYTTKNT